MSENQTNRNKVKLTAEQAEAVRYTGSNLLVSASAGSGKTAVLIERIMHILEHEENVSLKNMAIMTFTRAAAQEMKERLRSRVVKRLSEEGESEKWQKILFEIPTAYITTIDSFCNSIVREHFYKPGLDMNYTVMDPIEERMMESEIWQEMYKEGFDNSFDRSEGLSFEELTDYFDSGFFGEGLKETVLAVSHFCDSEPWPDEFLEDVEAFYSGTDKEAWIEGFKQEAVRSRWLDDYARFYNTDRASALDKLRQQGEFELLAGAVRALVNLVRLFRDRMAKAKRQKGRLTFSDLEHFALQILAQRKDKKSYQSSVGLSYAKTFAHIMVDEYQDSNYLQEEIINSISRGDNVFMVGDLKQSIYGFRQAKCEIFENKLNRYSEGVKGRIVFLSKNFRSDSRILDFVNRVCEYAMDGRSYGMKYEKEHLLQAGLSDEGNVGDRAVSVLLVKENYTYQKSETRNKHDAAALVIGRRIKELIRDRVTVSCKGKKKTVSYSDVAVLMRAKEGRIASYIRAFEALGIPYELTSANSFLDGPEVRVLLDYMRLIDNSLQDIPMAAVMLSFIGRFTEEELVRIRLFSHPNDSFYQAVKQYANPFLKKEEDKDKDREAFYDRNLSGRVEEFLQGIRELRAYRYLLPFSDWIGKVLKDTKAALYVSSSEQAQKKLEELRQLENLAISFESSEYEGLGDFLYYIEKLYENDCGPNCRNKAGTGSDAVRIMTIHGSKGLEFPVVFYTGLSGRFNIRSESPALHSTAGLGLPVIDLEHRTRKYSMIKNYIDDRNKKQQMEEEVRLMYVALTRAESELYLVFEGELDGILKKALYQHYPDYFKKEIAGKVSTIADYILPVLCKNDPAFFLHALYIDASDKAKSELSEHGDAVLQEVLQSRDKDPVGFGKANKVNLELCAFLDGYRDFDLSKEEEVVEEVREKDIKELAKGITENLQLEYQNKDFDKPVKLSVTKYKQAVQEEGHKTVEDRNLNEELGIRMETKDREDKAALGTLYHKILELWDFQKSFETVADIQAYIETLIKRNVIAQRASEVLDYKRILSFVESSLYRRMKQADLEARLFRERNFLYRVPAKEIYKEGGEQPVMIEGIIDAYFIEDEELVVVDYKSDQSSKPEYYRNTYRAPMELYAKALAKAYDRNVKERIIYSLKIGEVVL